MDIDTIPPGVDFPSVIADAVAACDVLIAVIGPNWLTLTDTSERRLLDSPEDFVRLEIRAALERDVRVIPALVRNASMPSSKELPDDIAALARRHAISLRADTWLHAVDRLIEAVEEVEPTSAAPPAPTAREAGAAEVRAPDEAIREITELTGLSHHKAAKAWRYVLEPWRVRGVTVTFESDTDTRSVIWDGENWTCDCALWADEQTCSHVAAMQLVLDPHRRLTHA
jgi:hypothetical protein